MKQPTDLSKRNDALYEAYIAAKVLARTLDEVRFDYEPDDLRHAWTRLQAKMEAVLP